MQFNQNLLSLGQALKEKREDQGFSLEQISEQIKVSVYILEGIEEAYVDRLPVYAYLRGFIIAYAKALGIDEKEIEKELKSLVPKEKETYLPGRTSPSTEAENLIEKDLRLTPVIIAIVILFVLGGILIFTNIIRSHGENTEPPTVTDLDVEKGQKEKSSADSELSKNEDLDVELKEEEKLQNSIDEKVKKEKPKATSTEKKVEKRKKVLSPDQVKDPIELVVKALGEVTISYQIDSNKKQEISLKVDQFEVLKGVENIFIKTDNSDLIYIFYQGKDLGVFGSGGEKQKIFSKSDNAIE